jgi:hypothetical protein
MGHRPVLSRKCWNCHLAFSEKLTKIIKSVIQPVFQTSHKGIILLRLEDERSASKIQVLSRLFQSYLNRLPDSFVVVTERQVRFARK